MTERRIGPTNRRIFRGLRGRRKYGFRVYDDFDRRTGPGGRRKTSVTRDRRAASKMDRRVRPQPAVPYPATDRRSSHGRRDALRYSPGRRGWGS